MSFPYILYFTSYFSKETRQLKQLLIIYKGRKIITIGPHNTCMPQSSTIILNRAIYSPLFFYHNVLMPSHII